MRSARGRPGAALDPRSLAFLCAIPVAGLAPAREPPTPVEPVAVRPGGTPRRRLPSLPMTIPGRVDAASLLLSLDPPTWFVRHARAVGEVAGFLAARIDGRGIAIDRRLVEAAALLHDVDKILPASDPAHALRHGDGSADWLTRHGHPELARAVAAHPVTRMFDGEGYKRWAAFATREERIVAYADKRAGQRLESMDARFASLAPALPAGQRRWRAGVGLGRCRVQGRSGSGRSAGSRRLPGGRDRAVGGPSPGLDRGGHAGGPPQGCRMTTSPLAYVWGDDDLGLGRAVDRLAAALAAEGGAPLERWDLRGDDGHGDPLLAALHERVATPVMFGGGTLAVVSNVGALMRTTVGRDAMLGAVGLLAPGNALVIVDVTKSGSEGPVAEAPGRSDQGGRRHGQGLPVAQGWRPRRLDRARGARAGPAARARGRRARSRSGSVASSSRTMPSVGTRPATPRWSSTSSRSTATRPRSRSRMSVPWSPRRCPGRSGASSMPSASGTTGQALALLERLLATTAEPVLVVVLHRRVRELLELGDRLAGGANLATAARAMGINSEYRAGTLAVQARNWTTDELAAALDGLVDLDALVKGAPGTSADAAQRRLAFTLWVMDHTMRRERRTA